MDFIMRMYRKYEDIVLYLIFGLLTTVVNVVVYYLFATVGGIHYLAANVIAWVAAVLFAYGTNRKYVFKSTAREITDVFREFTLFVGCRVFSLAMDMGIMFLMVSILGIHDFAAKLASQVVVIIANYVFSKLIIFKKKA